MHSNGMNALAKQCEDSENLITQFIDVNVFDTNMAVYKRNICYCVCLHSII